MTHSDKEVEAYAREAGLVEPENIHAFFRAVIATQSGRDPLSEEYIRTGRVALSETDTRSALAVLLRQNPAPNEDSAYEMASIILAQHARELASYLRVQHAGIRALGGDDEHFDAYRSLTEHADDLAPELPMCPPGTHTPSNPCPGGCADTPERNDL